MNRFKARLRGIIPFCGIGLLLAGVPALSATIIHTNDLLGELEPCGCRTNPLGGMAREFHLLGQLSEKDPSLLKLDAGDSLFSSAIVPEAMVRQAEVQATYLLKAMDLVKQDAFVPGEKDFALGVEALKKLHKNSSVKFLAANLKNRKGARLFDAHAIFVKNTENGSKLRIAVVGLVGEDLTWPSEVKVSPAIATAKSEVKALRSKADLVIALTHQGYDQDVRLAKAVKGIDIIIGGHSHSFLQKPVQEGKTWIYQSSFRNQYVGAIPVARPLPTEGYRLIGLDSAYDSPADKPTEMDRLIKDFKKAVSEVNSKESGGVESSQGANAPSAKFHTFPNCANCHLKQFDFWRKTPHSRAYHSLMKKEQAQNKECLGCHSVGLGVSSGFPFGISNVKALSEYHSDSANSQSTSGQEDANGSNSAAVNRELSPEELDRFLEDMGDASSLDTKVKVGKAESQKLPQAVRSLTWAWTPVQCENCHQRGGEHPFSGDYSKKVEDSACLKCHTADRAPEWYTESGQLNAEKFRAKRAKIACPAGELASDSD